MIRRLTATIALVACAGIYAFAASERVNILTNGERKSGTIAFHGGDHENLINGHLNIATDTKDMTFPVGHNDRATYLTHLTDQTRLQRVFPHQPAGPEQ